MKDRADAFDWSGGHPALHLVNTLDERPSESPVETLATYLDLVRFVELAGLLKPSACERLRRRRDAAACSLVLERVRELREHLHAILAAAHSGSPARRRDLAAISAAIQAAHGARTLIASPSPGLARQRWTRQAACEIPLHACALAVERLLVEENRARVRKCGASDCDVFYVDTSKGRRRQWCTMRGCGNREKQRRWRSAAR